MDGASLFGYSVMVGNPLQKTKKLISPVIGATKIKKQQKFFFVGQKTREQLLSENMC